MTAEFALAEIMDASPAITWWLRLEKADDAYIELDSGYKYHPDFIAIDRNQVSWIIEGKMNTAAQETLTQEKKIGAEQWVRHVSDHRSYGTWKYLFCTETSIKRAQGSWDALVTASGGLL